MGKACRRQVIGEKCRWNFIRKGKREDTVKNCLKVVKNVDLISGILIRKLN
jgi:hypothetical protein